MFIKEVGREPDLPLLVLIFMHDKAGILCLLRVYIISILQHNDDPCTFYAVGQSEDSISVLDKDS
ncbi:MAG: hypothetical protein D6820_04860 [Lentisphaerae bacterium]|nr:MAG: hypothetical protein D6820_04860 [Lentisphaerota bacterium]